MSQKQEITPTHFLTDKYRYNSIKAVRRVLMFLEKNKEWLLY